MKQRPKSARPDESDSRPDEIVHLARLALSGRQQDVQLFVRRMAKKARAENPALADQLSELLREAPTRSSPLRDATTPVVPVDFDSRLQLVRLQHVRDLDMEPVFSTKLRAALGQLVEERRGHLRLEAAGLEPSRSALFVGPPGVGKSLAASWLARELELPLLVLDLAAVMSSFLGRTGNNVRNVLDYAKEARCILFLDELDAIAKRRDDSTDVGELKRLVTVLLQEIDDWPPTGLLIAATNHPALLDPAVWRRFDTVLEFPMPSDETSAVAVTRFLGPLAKKTPELVRVFSLALRGMSFSDMERAILRVRRSLALVGDDERAAEIVLEQSLRERIGELPKASRADLAAELVSGGVVSQRRAYELTGVSRDTIRRRSEIGSDSERRQS